MGLPARPAGIWGTFVSADVRGMRNSDGDYVTVTTGFANLMM
jgi:hypothetical protein